MSRPDLQSRLNETRATPDADRAGNPRGQRWGRAGFSGWRPARRRFRSCVSDRRKPPDRRELAAIFAGGFVGAITRAELAQAVHRQAGEWPWATFSVNIIGALLLGYFTTRLQERLPVSAYRRPLLGTGFCGGLTTFATVQVELLAMLDAGHVVLAAAYSLASVVVGFAAVVVATNLVRRARLTG